jgi:hypothetical protein
MENIKYDNLIKIIINAGSCQGVECDDCFLVNKYTCINLSQSDIFKICCKELNILKLELI